MLVTMAWTVLAAQRAFAVSLWGSLWRYLVYLVPTMLSRHLLACSWALCRCAVHRLTAAPHPFARLPDLERNAPVAAPGPLIH